MRDNGRVSDLTAALRAAGVRPGELVGLAAGADGTARVALAGGAWTGAAAAVGAADQAVRPRWAVWSQETAQALVGQRVRLATCWDVAAVHRLLFGGWRAEPRLAWACLHGQSPDEVPAASGHPDLFSVAGDAPDPPVLGAAEAADAARLQLARLAGEGDAARVGTARSESTAELLCAELAADGLPVSLAAAEGLLAEIIGPRPRGAADAAATRAERDARVLRHAPAGAPGRPAQPRAGEDAALLGRHRRAGHPRVAA